MIITTKFNIGDKVHHIVQNNKVTKVKCRCCNGTGTVLKRTVKEKCGICLGKKEIKSYELLNWYVKKKKYTIEGIKVLLFGNTQIELYAISKANAVNSTEIFLTFGAAQIECKKRNKNVG